MVGCGMRCRCLFKFIVLIVGSRPLKTSAEGGSTYVGFFRNVGSKQWTSYAFGPVTLFSSLQVGAKQWKYYDFVPKVVPPLICIPGTAGSADVYYKQVMALSMKGYRVVSVDIPRVWNHQEWIQSFEKFLDTINVHHIHLYGSSLGGFLAQLFAQYRPRRVKSLVLSNTFLDTRSFAAAMPWSPVLSWTPSFLVKRYVLIGIQDGPHDPFIADSVDFVVSQVEAHSRDDLASRLTLMVDSASVAPLLLPDGSITIMDTHDYCAIPQHLKDEVAERYPQARRADLKSGGDFPFLSRSDEVNLHLQLHLRRVGVEPRPDLVPGATNTTDTASASDTENERAYANYQPRHYSARSSRVPSSSELIHDDIDANEPSKVDKENDGALLSDDQEVTDPFKVDEGGFRGPLRGYLSEDKDDTHGDGAESSSRDPLNSNDKNVETRNQPFDSSPEVSGGNAVLSGKEVAISGSSNDQVQDP